MAKKEKLYQVKKDAINGRYEVSYVDCLGKRHSASAYPDGRRKSEIVKELCEQLGLEY